MIVLVVGTFAGVLGIIFGAGWLLWLSRRGVLRLVLEAIEQTHVSVAFQIRQFVFAQDVTSSKELPISRYVTRATDGCGVRSAGLSPRPTTTRSLKVQLQRLSLKAER